MISQSLFSVMYQIAHETIYSFSACSPITFLCSLLEAEDRALRIAAGEALACVLS